MPELPDLLYIQKYLRKGVERRVIVGGTVKQPVVPRVATGQSFVEAVSNRRIEHIALRGPFIRFELSGSTDLVINLMLAGRLQHQIPGGKPEGHLCVSLTLDDGSRLNLCDDEKMAKAYVVPRGEYGIIPKYTNQGVDILTTAFTLDRFRQLAADNSRRQVRVFINDHVVLSAIGNAYADEILFEARLHPKTFVGKLTNEDLQRLHSSIREVMEWGIHKVEEAAQPIHVKIRDHMRVRNRKGEPCPRCGTTIRREGVRGYDVFFCPACQPASRKLFIDWKTTILLHISPILYSGAPL